MERLAHFKYPHCFQLIPGQHKKSKFTQIIFKRSGGGGQEIVRLYLWRRCEIVCMLRHNGESFAKINLDIIHRQHQSLKRFLPCVVNNSGSNLYVEPTRKDESKLSNNFFCTYEADACIVKEITASKHGWPQRGKTCNILDLFPIFLA